MTLEMTFVLLAVFMSVALASGLLASLALRWATPEQREIRRISHRGVEGIEELQLTDLPSPWVKRFQQAVPKSPKEMSRLRRRLTAAGYRGMGAAAAYGAAELLLPVVFAAGALSA